MEKLYTVSKRRLGADCGSDHELLIAKFRLKLKKVEKTTRPFRYDLNQLPYDYTVEVIEFQLSYFKSKKDDVVKVLHSICQQIWKTHQWPQHWKRSVFIPIPKKGNAKECSTIAQLHSSHMLAK